MLGMEWVEFSYGGKDWNSFESIIVILSYRYILVLGVFYENCNTFFFFLRDIWGLEVSSLVILGERMEEEVS